MFALISVIIGHLTVDLLKLKEKSNITNTHIATSVGRGDTGTVARWSAHLRSYLSDTSRCCKSPRRSTLSTTILYSSTLGLGTDVGERRANYHFQQQSRSFSFAILFFFSIQIEFSASSTPIFLGLNKSVLSVSEYIVSQHTYTFDFFLLVVTDELGDLLLAYEMLDSYFSYMKTGSHDL